MAIYNPSPRAIEDEEEKRRRAEELYRVYRGDAEQQNRAAIEAEERSKKLEELYRVYRGDEKQQNRVASDQDKWENYMKNVEPYTNSSQNTVDSLNRKLSGEYAPERVRTAMDGINDQAKGLIHAYTDQYKSGQQNTVAGANALAKQISSKSGLVGDELNDVLRQNEDAAAYYKDVQNGKGYKYLNSNEKYDYAKAKMDLLSPEEQDFLNNYRMAYSGSEFIKTGNTLRDAAGLIGSAKSTIDMFKIKGEAQKKFGWTPEQTDEYLGYAERVQNAADQEMANQKYAIDPNASTADKWKQGAINSVAALSNPLASIESMGAAVTGDSLGYDPNSRWNRNFNMKEAAQQEVTQNAIGGGKNSNELTFGQKAGQFLYGAGMSTLESAETIALGGAVGESATLVPFFASAFTSSVKDAKDRGLSDTQALQEGVLSGAAEAITEKVSLDSLYGLAKKKGYGFTKKMIADILAQGVIEGAEEGASDILNRLSDYLVAGRYGKTEQQYKIDEIMRNNPEMSEEEAAAEAEKDFWENLALDYVAGAISGLAMGGATTTFNASRRGKVTQESSELYGKYAREIEGNTEYDQQNKAQAEKYEKNPTRALADSINDSTEEGKAIKEELIKYAEKEAEKGKLSLNDNFRINQILEEAQNLDKNMIRDYSAVPNEYRTANTGITENEVRTKIVEGINNGSIEELESAYNLMKNASSPSLRESADEVFDQFKGKALSAGFTEEQLNSVKTTAEEAYLKGLNGAKLSEVGTLTNKGREAYNAGYEQRIKDNSELNKVLSESQKTEISKQAYIDNYKADINPVQYRAAFGRLYNAGASGISYDKANEGVTAGAIAVLGEETSKNIMAAGELERSNQIKQDQSNLVYKAVNGKIKKGTGTFTNSSVKAKDSDTRVLEAMAKAFNIDVEIADVINGDKSNRGMFDAENSKLWVRADAVSAMFHEQAEIIKFYNSEGYSRLQKSAAEAFIQLRGKDAYDHMLKAYNDTYSENESIKDSADEMANDILAAMMSTEEGQKAFIDYLAKNTTESESKSLLQTVKDWLQGLSNSLKKLLGDSNFNNRMQRDIYNNKLAEYDKVIGDFISTLDEALNTYKDINTEEGINRITEKVGIEYDEATESANPSDILSKDTWFESDYHTNAKAAAKELAKALDISEKKAMKYIKDINSIAYAIADDATRLDYDADPYSSSFVSNAEYGGSIDFSTICKKRLLYTGTLQAIQKQIGNRVITMEDYLEIRNAMLDDGLQTTCGCCYVEGSRVKLGQFMKEFIKRYAADNPAYVPTMYDVTMPDGIRQLRAKHPEVWEAREYFLNNMGQIKGHEGEKNVFGSQGKPKDYTERTSYRGEILNKFLNKKQYVDEKNTNGGLRLQSFSDFEIVNLIDCMQVIMDMSRCGLYGQAYTKVYEFADALGMTGLKINLSLMGAGVDENGDLILDEVNGMKKSDAIELRNKYSENVGTIIVAFTDEQIKAAMKSDYIDYIIPFHRSQWRKSQYEALGLPKGTRDYTMHQNDRIIKENGRLKKADRNYMPNEYWDYSKSGRANAEHYIDMCNKDGKAPKFPFLLEKDSNGKYYLPKGKEYDGYFKLLIDFKMYDNDGNGAPQRAVQPIFDVDNCKRMLDEYTGGHESFPVADKIAKKFADKIIARGGEFDYSSKMLSRDINDTIYSYSDGEEKNGYEILGVIEKSEAEKLLSNTDKLDKNYAGDYILRIGGNDKIVINSNDYLKPSRVYEILDGTFDRETVARIIIEGEKNGRIQDANRIVESYVGSGLFVRYDAIPGRYNGYYEGSTKRRKSFYHSGISEDEQDGKRISGTGKKPGYYLNKYGKKGLKLNSDYLDAIKRGDLDTAKEMLDTFADLAGYSVEAYHGSRSIFNVFDRSKLGSNTHTKISEKWFFAADKETASSYYPYGVMKELEKKNPNMFNAESLKPELRGKLYNLYLKLENPLVVDVKDYDYLSHRNNADAWMEYIKQAEEQGNDGIILLNAMDNQLKTGARESTVYMFKNPNQAKLSDVVTYDDDGNVIPLTERFDDSKDDIRYSKDVDQDIDIDDLLDDIDLEEELKEYNIDWKSITVGKILDDLKEKIDSYPPKERKKAVQHLTRKALGNAFNTEGQTVAYKDTTLDRFINLFASSNKDYAQAYITYMSPADFILMTANGNKGSETFNRLMNESHEFNEKEFTDSIRNQPMFLDIDQSNKITKVVGHEGRHRMIALQLAGYTKVPVLLFNYKNKYSKEYIDSMRLSPQKFSSDVKFNKSNEITLRDIEPLSSGNIDNVKAKFGDGANADVRFSKEVDTEGNSLTEGQADYFKDSKIRDDNGNLLVMYHGTKGDFNAFNPRQFGGENGKAEGYGIYLTDNPEVSNAYGQRIIKAYANVTKPASKFEQNITSNSLAKLIEETCKKEAQAFVDEGSYDKLSDALKDTWISNYVYTYDIPINTAYKEVAKSIMNMNDNDFDVVQEVMGGLAIRDYEGAYDFYDTLKETLGIDGFVTEWEDTNTGKLSKIVLAFESNQVKNVDNYEPTTSDDIRYSRDVDDVFWDMMANDEWKADDKNISILEEGLKALKNTQVDSRAIGKIASDIENEYGSNINHNEFKDMLNRAFAYIHNKNQVTYNDMMSIFEEIAKPVIDSSTSVEGKELYDGFVKNFKDVKIQLTENQLKEIKSTYGSYEEFKRAMRPLQFSIKGDYNLEQNWNEICDTFPGMFDKDTSEGDMPLVLNDMLNSLKPTVVNNFGADNEEASKDLAMRIVTDYFKAQADVKVKEAASKMAEENKKYRAEVRDRYNKRYAEAKEKLSRSSLSAEYNKKLLEAKAKNKEKLVNYKNRVEARKIQDSIIKNANKLIKWTMDATEEHHVPRDMQEPIMEFISALDFVDPVVTYKDGKYVAKVFDHKYIDSEGNTKMKYIEVSEDTREAALAKVNELVSNGLGSQNQRRWYDKMQGIKEMLDMVQKSDQFEHTDASAFLEMIDPELADEFSDMLSTNKGILDINNLGKDALRTIDKTIKNIIKAVNDQNKALTQKAYISDWAQDTIDYSSAVNVKDNFKIVNDMQKTFAIDMATPDTFFAMQGKAGQQIYKSFLDAFERKVNDIKTASEYMEEALKDVDLKGVTGDKAEVHTFNVGNGKISLTVAQIMSLYELNKRKQAVLHYRGGVEADTVKVRGREVTQNKPVHMTQQDIDNIIGTLTDKQKKLADKMQQFMATECAKWGNETSMMMYGYEKFADPNYFPISTDKTTNAVNNSNTNRESLNGIEKMGFTKKVQKNASNPIILKDIFDVFTNHITDMSAYHSYAPAVKDSNRWLNYKTIEDDGDFKTYTTVQSAINTNLFRRDNAGVDYYTKFIKDINGSERSGDISTFPDTMVGNYKAAAVAGNLRVVIQQPTAFVRAANILDPKYMMAALPKAALSNREMKRIKDASPMAWWKSQGYYEASLGKSIKEIVTGQNTLRDDIIEKSMWLAGKADDITWAVLYNATEKQIKAENPGLRGEEFTKKVNEKFNEVISQTQVVDCTIMKSQFMRANGKYTKLKTAFMSEPTKSYNMTLRAMNSDFREHGNNVLLWKATYKATAVLLVTDMLNSLAQSIIDGMRHREDDDDYWNVVLEYYKRNLLENVNPLGRVPIVKDFVDQIWDAIKGNSSYGSNNNSMDMAALSSISDVVRAISQMVQGKYNKNNYQTYMTFAKGLSNLTGIPAYNMSRDAVAMWNTFADDSLRIQKKAEKSSDKYNAIFTAVERDKSDEEVQKAIASALAKNGTISDIESKISTNYKSDYIEALENEDQKSADEIKADAMRVYEAIGVSAEDAEYNINEWLDEGLNFKALDKAITSGEGIGAAINDMGATEDDKDRILGHIVDKFGSTIGSGYESDIDENVNAALENLYGMTYEDAVDYLNVEKANRKYSPIFDALDRNKSDEEIKDSVIFALENNGTIKDIMSRVESRYKEDYVAAIESDDAISDEIVAEASRIFEALGMTDAQIQDEMDSWLESEYSYTGIDKAITDGKDIDTMVAELKEADKKEENVIKHFVNKYASTVEFNKTNNVNSTLEENLDKVMKDMYGISFNQAVAKQIQSDKESAEKQAATELKSAAREKLADSIIKGSDFKSSIENMVKAGYEYKTVETNITKDIKPQVVEYYKNGNKEMANKLMQRAAYAKAYCDEKEGQKLPKKYKDYYTYELAQIKKWIE